MPNRIVLREFAYFDRQKVEDFLSSIEGGLARKRTEATSKPSAGVGGRIRAGIAEVGGGIEHRGGELKELKESTDASLFQRLYARLEKHGLVKVLEKMDEETFSTLKVGDVLELSGEVELSRMETLVDLLMSYLPLTKSSETGESESASWHVLFSYLRFLRRGGINIKIVLQDKTYSVVAKLTKENLRVPKQDLNAEYKVLCRVQRKLKEGEAFDLFSLAPGIKLPEEAVQNMVKTFPPDLVVLTGKPLEIEDFRISYPAVIVTPIAVYR